MGTLEVEVCTQRVKGNTNGIGEMEHLPEKDMTETHTQDERDSNGIWQSVCSNRPMVEKDVENHQPLDTRREGLPC